MRSTRSLPAVARTATATLAIGAILVGCAGTQEPVERVAPGDLESASGEFSAWIAIDGPQRAAYEAYTVESFNEDYPNVRPKISYRTLDRVDQQIQTALAAGQGPDLVVAGGPSIIGNYAEAGHLLPLDEYASANDWSDKLLPWALESGRVDGKLYAIPTSYETLVMFYNKTLFEERGYDIPETRAELEEIAADLSADGIIPFASGNAEFQLVSQWWASTLINHGAGPEATYAALRGEKSFADPEFVEAATVVRDWFDRGWVQGSAQQYFVTQFGTMYDAFASGRAGMFLSGSWEFPTLNEYFAAAGTEYDWFPVPAWNSDSAYPMYEVGIGSTASISANSRNPDAVAAHLNWLVTDREAMLDYVVETDASPLPVTLAASDFPDGMNPLVASHFEAISEATEAGNFGYLVWTFWPPQASEFLSIGFDRLIAGDITPEEYCREHARLFEMELDQGLVPAPIERTP